MAMKVVDVLEVVEVDQEHDQAGAGAAPVLDGLVQEAVEQCPVGETGEAVVVRLVS